MDAIKNKLNNMMAGEVLEILHSLKDKFDDASMLVFEIGLEVLESKVSEEKFIEVTANL